VRYTSLEQERPVNPSRTVVAALADALRLTGVDRSYLFTLAGHTPPTTAEAPGTDGDYAQWPADRRNLLWLLFEEPRFGEHLVDRAEYAARVVRTFRSRSDTYLNDPVAIEMVDTLSRRSPQFKALWEAHDVRRADTDTLQAVHPGGRLVLTLVTLQGVTSSAIWFNAYLPADAATAALLGIAYG